jgi:hypothetical protein
MYVSAAYCQILCSNFLFVFTEIADHKCSLRVMLCVFVAVVSPAHCVTSVHCVLFFNFRVVRPSFQFGLIRFHIDGLIPNQILKVITPFTYTSQIYLPFDYGYRLIF